MVSLPPPPSHPPGRSPRQVPVGMCDNRRGLVWHFNCRLNKNKYPPYRSPNSIRLPSSRATLAIVFNVIEVFSGSSSRSTPVRLVFNRLAISALLMLRSFIALSSSRAILNLNADTWHFSRMPSSARKSSKLEPKCFCFMVSPTFTESFIRRGVARSSPCARG